MLLNMHIYLPRSACFQQDVSKCQLVPAEYSETAYLPGPGLVEYRHVKKATLSLGVFCSSYMSVVPKHAHVETCGLGKHCAPLTRGRGSI